MSAQNPFRDFWQKLKGRGLLNKGVYQVTLSNDEVATLAKLATSYQGVKGVVARTQGNTVEFHTKPAIDLANKSGLRPFRR